MLLPCPVPKERPLTSFAIAGTRHDLGWNPELHAEHRVAHVAAGGMEGFSSGGCFGNAAGARGAVLGVLGVFVAYSSPRALVVEFVSLK